MPIGDPLVLVRDLQNARFVPGASDDLQADRQVVARKTARHRNRGHACDVKRRSERGQMTR